jgi:hypothetical protein
MTLEKVSRKEAIDRATLHRRLREWVAATARSDVIDPTIGPISNACGPIGVSAWVHVRDDGGGLFCLHADVKRSSVVKYLERVDRHGDGLAWTVVPNQRGRMNAVAYGPDAVRITPYYFYLVKRADGDKAI